VPSARHGTGLRYRARYVDDTGRERTKAFAKKLAADRWLNKVISDQITGTYVDPERGAVTFSSFYTEWSQRQVWVSGTRHAMDLAANSATFGDVALDELRASHLEAWVKAMQNSELEPTTIRTRFANVRSVLRAAVRDRFLGRDVTDRVRLPRARKATAAMAIPTPEQVGSILAADSEYTALFAVCAFAGLRRGEASALQVHDVDFLRRELHVRRQVQWTDDGQMEIRPPKYGAERTVYIPEALVSLLASHIAQHCPGEDPGRWLFRGRRDRTQPIHAVTVARAWRAARDSVKLEYRLHDLRHFYASGLIRAGCDVVTVQRALGHSSAAITLTTYSAFVAGRRRPDPQGRWGSDRGVAGICCVPTAY